MTGLTIGWEYLTGYCVATDPASYQRAEWPPHPARVFMALAAAWFETGENADEGKALRWLESLGNPEMSLPASNDVFPRKVVETYVPVNDSAGPSKAIVQSAPSITRDRKERTFPTISVGDAHCFLHWPNATATDIGSHGLALDRLCGKVTRIGHSSSLVRMWLAEEPRSPRPSEVWTSDDALAEFQARRVSDGTLDLLERQFNRRGREAHDQLSNEIEALTAQKRSIRGRGASQRRAAIDEQIEAVRERRNLIDNRAAIRPKLGLWSGYRRQRPTLSADAQRSAFDSDMLILTKKNGPALPAVSTLVVTQALRGTVLGHAHQLCCGCNRWDKGRPKPEEAPECYAKIPSWLSGHATNGEPLRDGRQHLAFLPLPYVGGDYADGHLLGAALAFPAWVTRQERGRILGSMLVLSSGESKSVTLKMGAAGSWSLVKRDWNESAKTLKQESWTAHPDGAQIWASVTPVVLDGFPKKDSLDDRVAWCQEVEEIIVEACARVGIPKPESINFGTTSWHTGSPRASLTRRPLRGHPEVADGSAGLGDGFPPYPAKKTTGIRPQFHVWLRFAEPVVGPIIVGAARFLGYGLCMPLWGGRS